MSDAASRTGLAGFISEHRLASFIALACGISWSTATLALHPASPVPEPFATGLDYLAKFGPSIAGLIVVSAIGADERARLLAGLRRWRLHPGWYALALFGPLLVWGIAAASTIASGELEPELHAAGILMFVPLLLKHTLIGGGLGEELGWRGFMLPELQSRGSALRASLIVGLVWGLWHLPAFLLPATGKEGADIVSLVLFTILTIVLSILFTWVFNSARASLLLVVLLHGSFNASENALKTALPVLRGDGGTTITYGLLLLALALVLIFVAGPRTLSFSRSPNTLESGEPG